MSARRISRNMISLSFAEIFSKVLQFVIMVYAARVLDKESFGVFSFALAFSFIAVIIADLGINTYIIREIARDKSKAAKYYGSAFLVKLLLSAATFVLIFILLQFLGYEGSSRIVVYLVWLFAILSSFTDLSYSIFRSFEKMGYDSFIKILRMLILIALAFYVLSNNYGVVFFSLSFVITEIIIFLLSLALAVSRFVKPSFDFSLAFMKSLLHSSIPFGFSAVFGSIYFYIDSVLISKLRNDVEVAYYGAAYNLVLALLFVPGIYTTAIYPVMSRYFKKDNKTLQFIYERSFKYLYIMGLPMSFGVYLLADRILSFLYSGKYAASVIALQIVAWFIFLKFINFLLGTVLSSTDSQKYRMHAQAATAFFNIVLNLALIPYIGFVGAAISTLLTEIFLFALYYYYVSKHFYLLDFLHLIPKPLTACLIMAGFIIYTALNLIITVLLSAFIYAILLLLFKTFDKTDISLLTKIMKNESLQS